MECKNCQLALTESQNYCGSCGAKVIRNRLTFKNLWHEFTERFFNVDNTFLKTFRHLFTKPQLVIGGYIQGIRKKYMNPISYLGIALTLSGLSIFLMRKFFWDDLILASIQTQDGADPETMEKIMGITFDFNSFLFLLYIPMLAIPAFVIINKNKFNLSEYLLTFIYVMSHFSIVSFFVTMILLVFVPTIYMSTSMWMYSLMFIYSLYVLQKMNRFKIPALILRSGLFAGVVLLGFVITITILMGVILMSGVMDLQDFAPKK